MYSLVDELIDQLHVIPYAKKKTLAYDDHGAPLHESFQSCIYYERSASYACYGSIYYASSTSYIYYVSFVSYKLIRGEFPLLLIEKYQVSSMFTKISISWKFHVALTLFDSLFSWLIVVP